MTNVNNNNSSATQASQADILQKVFETGFKMAGVSPVGVVTNATTTLKIATQSLENRILEAHQKANPANFQSGIFKSHFESKRKKAYSDYQQMTMFADEVTDELSQEEFNDDYLARDIELYKAESEYLQSAIESLNSRIGKASHIDEIKNNYDNYNFKNRLRLKLDWTLGAYWK